MRPFARNRSFAGWFVKFRAESLRSGREFRYANDRSWPPAAPWMEIVGELTLSDPLRSLVSVGYWKPKQLTATGCRDPLTARYLASGSDASKDI
jgi:hypothetical protein